MAEDVTYRFVGTSPEVFPDPPIHAELASGDEFEAPPGLVHPRLEVGTAHGGWEPTVTDENRNPPHDPAPHLSAADPEPVSTPDALSVAKAADGPSWPAETERA